MSNSLDFNILIAGAEWDGCNCFLSHIRAGWGQGKTFNSLG